MTGAPRPRPLPPHEVDEHLPSLPGWSREGIALVRAVEFDSFADAMVCVNRVAAEAERMDHHPDMNVSYRTVTFRLSSHDAGGITDRDLRLAARISALVT